MVYDKKTSLNSSAGASDSPKGSSDTPADSSDTQQSYGEGTTFSLCPMCHMCVQDEIHVLLECNIYSDIQAQLLKDIVNAHSNVLMYSKREILKCILGCNNEILVKICAKACHEILSWRGQK